MKNAESYYQHIHWLQTRFPKAIYEDVTGLCKLATHSELQEQDYSLNAGRYVGVVIEEDGKTEEEFINEITYFNDELGLINRDANDLSKIIFENIQRLVN